MFSVLWLNALEIVARRALMLDTMRRDKASSSGCNIVARPVVVVVVFFFFFNLYF